MNRLIKIDREKYMIKGTDLYVNFNGYNLFIVYKVDEFNNYIELATTDSNKKLIEFIDNYKG